MRVLVDADACPVKDIILDICKSNNIELKMFFDNSHEYFDNYSEVIIVDKSKDSVDLNIISNLKTNDIVVTQDYGLASIVISKDAKAINNNGMIYTNDNIDKLLFERFISSKNRRAGIKTSNMKKRTNKMNEEFKKNFLILLKL